MKNKKFNFNKKYNYKYNKNKKFKYSGGKDNNTDSNEKKKTIIDNLEKKIKNVNEKNKKILNKLIENKKIGIELNKEEHEKKKLLLSNFYESSIKLFNFIFDNLKKLFTFLWNNIKLLITLISTKFFPFFFDILYKIFNTCIRVIIFLGDKFTIFIGYANSFIRNIISTMGNMLGWMASNFISALASAFHTVIGAFGKLFYGGVFFTSVGAPSWLDTIRKIIKNLYFAILKACKFLYQIIKDIFDRIYRFFKDVADYFYRFFNSQPVNKILNILVFLIIFIIIVIGFGIIFKKINIWGHSSKETPTTIGGTTSIDGTNENNARRSETAIQESSSSNTVNLFIWIVSSNTPSSNELTFENGEDKTTLINILDENYNTNPTINITDKLNERLSNLKKPLGFYLKSIKDSTVYYVLSKTLEFGSSISKTGTSDDKRNVIEIMFNTGNIKNDFNTNYIQYTDYLKTNWNKLKELQIDYYRLDDYNLDDLYKLYDEDYLNFEDYSKIHKNYDLNWRNFIMNPIGFLNDYFNMTLDPSTSLFWKLNKFYDRFLDILDVNYIKFFQNTEYIENLHNRAMNTEVRLNNMIYNKENRNDIIIPNDITISHILEKNLSDIEKKLFNYKFSDKDYSINNTIDITIPYKNNKFDCTSTYYTQIGESELYIDVTESQSPNNNGCYFIKNN